MTHEDISRRIPDYVLGLLSARQLGEVEHHVAHCPDCRRLVRREKRVGQLVRLTINAATRPDATRLQRLMPAIPHRRQSVVWHSQGWPKQLAPVLLLLLLAFGGFILQRTLPEGSVPAFVVTAHAATATTTNTPTATLAQSSPPKSAGHEPFDVQVNTAVGPAMPLPSPDSEQPLATPGPLPTPVAAIIGTTAQ
jgi:anti-sigma factor RsiW